MNEITNDELGKLAAEIRIEHNLCLVAMQSSLEHAVNCGELLIKAKEKIPFGGWLSWLADNCEFSERTAQVYMRVAERWPELAKTQRVADLSLRNAVMLLEEPREKASFDDWEEAHKNWEKADTEAWAAIPEALSELNDRLNQADTLPEVLEILRDVTRLEDAITEYRLRVGRYFGRILNDLEREGYIVDTRG